MVLPSPSRLSLLQHSRRTNTMLLKCFAATTVLRPDSRVTLSRKYPMLASVAKVGSSSISSAAYSRAPRFGDECCRRVPSQTVW
eukprot:5631421-Amphidinium_carterae.1